MEALADRTKVPKTTILYLMGEPVSAILPERVYLRGHLDVLGRELRTDGLPAMFDACFPQTEAPDRPEEDRFRAQSTVVSATLGGVALLSVVAAFLSAVE